MPEAIAGLRAHIGRDRADFPIDILSTICVTICVTDEAEPLDSDRVGRQAGRLRGPREIRRLVQSWSGM